MDILRRVSIGENRCVFSNRRHQPAVELKRMLMGWYFQNVGAATRNSRHAIFVRAEPSGGTSGKFVPKYRKQHTGV